MKKSKIPSNCKVNRELDAKLLLTQNRLSTVSSAMELRRFIFVLLKIWLDFNEISGTLVIPQSGHARHQFIIGFGIPVTSNQEAVNVGVVFKAQYKLVR